MPANPFEPPVSPEYNVRMKSGWISCPAVDRSPRKVGGAWVFRDTRVPVTALFENLEDGATVDQFLEWFPGVKRSQVEAVIEHTAATLAVPAA